MTATYYCTADGTGPLVLAAPLAPEQHAVCPSHVLRNGNVPRIYRDRPERRAATAAELAEAEAILAAAGHDVDATTDSGEALRCPECLSPLRLSESAEVWTPPEIEPAAPPAPTVVYRSSATLVSNEASFDSLSWRSIGRVTTSVAGLLKGESNPTGDTSRAIGAFVGEVEAVGGAVVLRLVERALDGTERVLAESTHAAGLHPYVQTMTDAGAPGRGPCAYRLEGRTQGASIGWARGVSLALYEVLS